MRYSHSYPLANIIGSYSLLIGISLIGIVAAGILVNRTGALLSVSLIGAFGALFVIQGIMLIMRITWARLALSVTLHAFVIALAVVAVGVWNSLKIAFTLFAISAVLLVASSVVSMILILHSDAFACQSKKEDLTKTSNESP